MAKASGIGDRLYINGYDLSGDVGSINKISTPRPALDVTAINSAAHERILGLSDVQVAFSAYYNPATKRSHAALKTLQTTARPTLYARGSTAGEPCLFFNAKQINYDGTRAADGSLLFKVDINGSNGVPGEWGTLLCNALTTVAAPIALATIDNGAKSSKGAAALLQVTQKSSTGNMTVRIFHSSDAVSWSSMLGFTLIASGSSRNAERKTSTGLVKRYLRVDTTGAFTNAKLTVGLRRGSTGEVITY